SQRPVGLVSWPIVARGADAIRAALAGAAGRDETLAIVDAITDADLVAIGRAAHDAPLLTGGSGIAIGLPGNFIRAGLARGEGVSPRRVDGAEAILSGSCSIATRGQIERHKAAHPALEIDVPAVMAGRLGASDLVAFVRANAGRSPLVYSSAAPDVVAGLQERFGRDAVAHRLDALFGETARLLVDGGVRRLVAAGGETSGAVVSALDIGAVEIGPEIDPGVPVLTTPDGKLALALKSGNFGAEDFFEKALGRMAS
ncbi:MAG: four-carbon acid sugar kinase family protein, partial [Beijerinckiaceae bacterium]